ncbi:hypothetical protein ACG7TL_004566 [Trametes sanguinea]
MSSPYKGLPGQELESAFDLLSATIESLPDQEPETLCDALEMYLHEMTPTSEGPREIPPVPEPADYVVPAVDPGATSALCPPPPMSRTQSNSPSSAHSGRILPSNSESASPPPLYRSRVPSSPSSPDLQTVALTTAPPLTRAAETDPSGAPPAKYRRVESHSDDDSDGDGNPGFIYNATKRMKSHSKRLPVVLKKIGALNVATRPHILFYCSRPESVGHRNGSATIFMTNNLKDILGPTFLQDVHQKVADASRKGSAVSAADMAIRNNFEVENLRREKNATQARLDAALRRMKDLGISCEGFEES